jgi:hypothetical protein
MLSGWVGLLRLVEGLGLIGCGCCTSFAFLAGFFTPPSPRPLPPVGVRGVQCGQPIWPLRAEYGINGGALPLGLFELVSSR